MFGGYPINITVIRGVCEFHERVVRHDAEGRDNGLVVSSSNQRD